MPPKSKLKWRESIEEDFWLVIGFSVIFCEEEEERTSKEASVLGTASALRPNFWPIVSETFSLVLLFL